MGLAVGDDQTGVVSPHAVVNCHGPAAAAELIVDTARRVGATRVVIGVPARADGSLGPAARRSELLALSLRDLGIEVSLQPEYLSTNEARRRARSIGRPQTRPVDDLAAQIILEDYFAAGLKNPPAEG
jgi:RNase H-fold protein (predicted Holliday junction resolvase)